ncbi:MAG: YihA family ribosome biogenesis GTP-binding protein [Alphaproteobacteria bacterium]|nr:YihA family ribosome biogenesis GTP-binding protein [Alphaproteobacteria bacterium]
MTSGIGADLDEAALEVGRLLFAQSCDFIISATNMDQLPSPDLPEIAFAGRSNVGKSSLINALTGRNTLARTSNTPGRTRLLNFFDLGHRLVLTDLPGYGFARAPKTEIAEWTNLIEDYLRGRAILRRVCLLIDARHGAKASDRQAMDLLDQSAVPYQIVLTKCDKVKKDPLQARIDAITGELAKHTAAHPDIITTSSRKGDGIAELRAALATLAAT